MPQASTHSLPNLKHPGGGKFGPMNIFKCFTLCREGYGSVHASVRACGCYCHTTPQDRNDVVWHAHNMDFWKGFFSLPIVSSVANFTKTGMTPYILVTWVSFPFFVQ